jgi:hypothetical protein
MSRDKNTLVILLAVLFVVSLTAASAGASSLTSSSKKTEIKLISPYQYRLSGNGIRVTYTPMGPGAVPNLVYKDKKFGTLHFTDQEIRCVDVPDLGTLVSVTLGTAKLIEGAPPQPLFTFLLPKVNLLNQKKASAAIHTIGITTSYKSASLPPSAHIGQVESYIITNLSGTASNCNNIIPLDDFSKNIKVSEINSDTKINEPNQFILNGIGQKHKDVHLSYSTDSITGKPTFNYEDSRDTYRFTGDEIRTQKTEIGTIVTVTLKSVPDLHVITLTLLVPSINLNGSAQEFKTIAIRTTSKTTIAGESLIKGAVQSYEVIDLQGTANSVMY